MKTIRVGRVKHLSEGNVVFENVTNNDIFEVSAKMVMKLAKVAAINPDEVYEVINDEKDYTSIKKVEKDKPNIPAVQEQKELKLVDNVTEISLPTLENFKAMRKMLRKVDAVVLQDIRDLRKDIVRMLIEADRIEPDNDKKMLFEVPTKKGIQVSITKNGAFLLMSILNISCVGWKSEKIGLAEVGDVTKSILGDCIAVVVKMQDINGEFYGKGTASPFEPGKFDMCDKAIEATAKTRAIKNSIKDRYRLWHLEKDVVEILAPQQK